MVVSRRAVVEPEYSAEREHCCPTCREGAVVKGVVKKNLTDYGAFVDLGIDDLPLRYLLIWPGSASSIRPKW
ncbi:MAG: hypothetical protein R3F24_11830 [Gammaproteobacteria bacterium]